MSISKQFKGYVILLTMCSILWSYPGQVADSLKAPAGFSTGLTFDGQHLWVADYMADSLLALDPITGKVVRKIASPGFWPMGLAWDGKMLWNVDKLQKKLFQIDPLTGEIKQVMDAPCSNPGGLTWDGSAIWVSDFKKNLIMQIDMNDGTAVKKFDGPAKSVDGLTFDGEYLWSSDRKKDEIYMIDAQTGEVLIIIDAPEQYARGLTWDGKHLWNVDFQADMIYKLIRQDEETYKLSDIRHAQITFTHEVKVLGDGQVNHLETYIAKPTDLNQQKILKMDYYPVDHKIEKDRWGQQVAVFNYADIPSNEKRRSQLKIQCEISKIRYFIFPDKVGSLEEIPTKIRKKYTEDGSKYLMSDPYIKELSKKIVGDEKNPYWIARKIFDHVRNALEYKLEGGWNVAPVVLKRGTGSCSEYSISFIALARSAGLPARFVGAYVVRGDDASMDDVFHRWPEVYLPNYGWIPIDPQGGDKPAPADRLRNIGSLPNRFLITTQGGGDSEFLGWQYNYNEKYSMDPKVQVQIETFAEWQPLVK